MSNKDIKNELVNLKPIKVNPNNKKYYSEDFIKGFECGAKRQFEADRKEDEWIEYRGLWKCSICSETENRATRFCPNCGAKMNGSRR